MDQKIKEGPMSALPRSLIKNISDELHNYSTGLIKITYDETGKETANLIGSGTFVQINNICGILTAQHVTTILTDISLLGLTLISKEHKHLIETDHLNIIEIAKATEPSEGPDLSFIALPTTYLGTIKATKSFYNLSKKKDRILNDPPKFDMGIWFICGVPDEQTTKEKSEKGFDFLKGFHGFCGAAGVDRNYTKGNYDYCEVDIHYKKSENLPQSFGGVSGGGLWQIPLFQDEKGNFTAKEYILSGIAFYQSELKNQYRFIKCHGRQSLYKITYEFVESKYS